MSNDVQKSFRIAIETSSREGSLAIGDESQMLEAIALPPQKRHGVHLMPKLEELVAKHGFTPAQLGRIYLSIGPGSFTGIRVAVAAAKTMARVTGAKCFTIPTLDVVVRNAPAEENRVALCMNARRGKMYTGFYSREEGGPWTCHWSPQLLTPEELLERVSGEFYVIGDHLPEADWPSSVRFADEKVCTPQAAALYALGEALGDDEAVDPLALVPLYVRVPEAEENWQLAQAAKED